MGKFPRPESEVVNLADTMVNGLTENPAVYPEPPVLPVALTGLIAAYNDAKNAAVAAGAAAEAATVSKMDALDALATAMKSDIRYAENTVSYENDKLRLIGWLGRKEPTPLAAPGQSRLLAVVKQGEGWVSFTWKAPLEGGAVAAYRVMRRERPEGPWQEVQSAVYPEATLADQPRGKEYEFRVIAVNRAGEGEPSNTELVVL